MVHTIDGIVIGTVETLREYQNKNEILIGQTSTAMQKLGKGRQGFLEIKDA